MARGHGPPGEGRGPAEAGRALPSEPLDAAGERRGDLRLVGVRGQQLLLVGVADERHLDEHGRHRRAHQHAEGRLLHPAPLAARDHRELLLDARGEGGGLLEVLGLRHVPEDEREVGAPRGLAERLRRALRLGHPPRLVVARLVGEEVHLAPLRPPRAAGVRVDRDEEVGLVVVRDRGALVEPHLRVAVAGQEDLEAARVDELGPELARDRQRHVLLERAPAPLRPHVLPAVAGVDHHRPNGRLFRRPRGARRGRERTRLLAGSEGRPAELEHEPRRRLLLRRLQLPEARAELDREDVVRAADELHGLDDAAGQPPGRERRRRRGRAGRRR